jgi:hypothetical protein
MGSGGLTGSGGGLVHLVANIVVNSGTINVGCNDGAPGSISYNFNFILILILFIFIYLFF